MPRPPRTFGSAVTCELLRASGIPGALAPRSDIAADSKVRVPGQCPNAPPRDLLKGRCHNSREEENEDEEDLIAVHHGRANRSASAPFTCTAQNQYKFCGPGRLKSAVRMDAQLLISNVTQIIVTVRGQLMLRLLPETPLKLHFSF
jgi:hypothetical protein